MGEPDYVRSTRSSYDSLAEFYAEWIQDELAAKPLDRALLGGFAEVVRASGAGPVADIGCGPGRVTTHLGGLGLPAFGIDLSPNMVGIARRTYPALSFAAGSMLSLPLADGVLGGIVAWYSIIHVPSEHLPVVFGEFRRVLRAGGHVLLAFQIGGDQCLHRTEAGGYPVSLDFHQRDPAGIAGLLAAAGFVPRTTTVRQPDEDGPFPERTRQGFLLARKP